jgi:hypothetical protein
VELRAKVEQPNGAPALTARRYSTSLPKGHNETG